MSAKSKDYPASAHSEWLGFERFLFMGPFTGIVAGFAQFMACVTVAIIAEDLDAAFRGPSGVIMTLLLSMLMGGILGCVSGAILLVYERHFPRRVRPIIVWPLVMLPVFLTMLWALGIEARNEIKGPSMFFAVMLSPFVFGIVVPILSSSAPSKSQPNP